MSLSLRIYILLWWDVTYASMVLKVRDAAKVDPQQTQNGRLNSNLEKQRETT